MVIAIKIRMVFRFAVTNNVVTVEDILDMHNVDDIIHEAERYDTRIQCH